MALPDDKIIPTPSTAQTLALELAHFEKSIADSASFSAADKSELIGQIGLMAQAILNDADPAFLNEFNRVYTGERIAEGLDQDLTVESSMTNSPIEEGFIQASRNPEPRS